MPAMPLTPDHCTVVLTDHQVCLLDAVDEADRTAVATNTVALARAARDRDVPIVATALLEPQGTGRLLDGLAAVLPGGTPLARSCMDPWRDRRVVEAVGRTARPVVVLAGLWTELCVLSTAQGALRSGYRVLLVTDASAGLWSGAHEYALARMERAGAELVTTAEVVDGFRAAGLRPGRVGGALPVPA